jgi:hypothetical protein
MKLRAAGQPPVEARVIDQNDGVGPLMAEKAIGAANKVEESTRVGQDPGEPHYGQGTEWIEEMTTSLVHALTAETDKFGIGALATQGANEIGAVKVAARLAGTEEDAHASLPLLS